MDLFFHNICVGLLFFSNHTIIKENIIKEDGRDWDRIYRLKVFEGLLAMSVIDLATRVKLILDAVTSYELLDYIKFVEYTVSSQVGGESCQVIFNKILLF